MSSFRRTGVAWWSLAKSVVIAVAITVAVCLLAMLAKFTINIAFFAILAAVVTAGVWVARRAIEVGPEIHDTKPVLDVAHLVNRNGDSRVRKLEEFMYGSQPHFDLASGELRHAVARAVEVRLSGTPRSVLSPRLRNYLEASRPQPIDRRTLHQFIKEISAL